MISAFVVSKVRIYPSDQNCLHTSIVAGTFILLVCLAAHGQAARLLYFPPPEQVTSGNTRTGFSSFHSTARLGARTGGVSVRIYANCTKHQSAGIGRSVSVEQPNGMHRGMSILPRLACADPPWESQTQQVECQNCLTA